MHGHDPQFQSLLSARDAAFDEKQRLWQPMEDAYQETVRLRAKDPRIDSLFDQAQREHEQGRAAAAASQEAYHNGTGQAGAYSQQKQQYYNRRDSLRAEAKALIERLRADRDAAHNQWEAARQRFLAARDTYNTARDAFNAYRRIHRYISHPGDAELAMQAGVPVEFHGNLYVSMDEKGNRQIYYGGEGGDPLGAGHGHYVLDKYGNVTYRRPPQAEHGVQNVVGYQPPAKKAATKQQPRPGTRQADQQAARDREDARLREEARQARERLEAAEREERHRRDTPWIAAQAAADVARAQAQAETAAQVARREAEVAQPLHPALRRVHSPLLLAFREKQMQIRVANALAAQPAPVQMPVAPRQPEPVTQEIPAVTGHAPATDHRRPPREPEQRPRPTQSARPTPPVAPPVQPPAQPTPPTQPAKAGTGKKWETTADRIKREKREAEEAAAAEGHGPARDFKRSVKLSAAEEQVINAELASLRGDMDRLQSGAYSAEADRRYIELKRSLGKKSGFGLSQHGTIGGQDVTFAFGWGDNEGHTLIADGHVTDREFLIEEHHNHYGPGDGPHDNAVPGRFYYTGPGA